MDIGRMLESSRTLAVLLLMSMATISAQVFRKDSETSLRLLPTNNHKPSRTCNVDCSLELTQFVCATDGRTYTNRCELQRVNCDLSGPTAAIQVKHVGRCHEKYRCRSEQAHAQEVLARGAAGHDPQSTANLFEPKCREDGSYAPVQCHSATGYCWCVTPTGRPVRGSSVRNRRPYCKNRAAILGKTGNRRSNVRRGGPVQRKPVSRQGCNQVEKLLFKKNLVKIFVSEYARMTSLSMMQTVSGVTTVTVATTVDPVLNSAEKKAVDWKFTELDKNGNNFLDKKEVKSLRRMVKKIVKPRECAKRFTKFCDLDRSGRIGRNEWTVCFGMGMNKEQAVVSAGVGQTGTDDGSSSDDENDDDDDDDDDVSISDQHHHQHHTTDDMEGVVGQLPSAPRNKQMTLTEDDKVGDLNEEDDEDEDEDEDMDCQTERRSALEQQRATQDSLYIPECGADDDDDDSGHSMYAQVQCYKSTDYCWCVDQLTGKPIPNTSVRYMRPDCERLIRAERPIKGCPDKKKLKFVADFTDFLTKEMNTALNQTQSSPPSGPIQQKVIVDALARWKFGNLDNNDNKVLDRKEWRIFRVELKKRHSIRKCGRNFVKFCDEDDDKKITYTEWQECFNVLVERTANPPSRGIKRPNGPNPLITYLKND